jgi:phospholipid/cholesterol/gamma-HCH transport system substrate-binding protein
MVDQFKNMMIGIFVVAAFAIIVFMMLFLHPNLGDEGKTFRVRFADIDKITPGTRVTFAGKPVGEVVSIHEIQNGERVEHNGIIYIYELELAIDSQAAVYATDTIIARTSGLLGEKSVEITPQILNKNQQYTPITNQILYASETGSVESTLKQFNSLSDRIQVALDDFIEALDSMRQGNMWNYLSDAVKQIDHIATGFNESKIWVRANKVVNSLDSITTSLNDPQRLGKILENLHQFSSSGLNIFTQIEHGEGSLGRMLATDEFYLSIASLFSKAEIVLNDINHYGLLFHQDKGWQRLRARRLNLLQTLKTPQEFRNYFNDEIDSIATSLERVSMVIEEVECLPNFSLWQDPCYIKVYSELLRRVATLEEYLQMYNQQVIDTQVLKTEFTYYP